MKRNIIVLLATILTVSLFVKNKFFADKTTVQYSDLNISTTSLKGEEHSDEESEYKNLLKDYYNGLRNMRKNTQQNFSALLDSHGDKKLAEKLEVYPDVDIENVSIDELDKLILIEKDRLVKLNSYIRVYGNGTYSLKQDEIEKETEK